MGVKGLSMFLKKRYPHVFVPHANLNAFINKRAAIDVSIFLYKFAYGKDPEDDTAFLENFVLQYNQLNLCGVRPVYVFDGLGEHAGKEREREKRAARTARTQQLQQEKLAVLRDELVIITETIAGADDILPPSTPPSTPTPTPATPPEVIEVYVDVANIDVAALVVPSRPPSPTSSLPTAPEIVAIQDQINKVERSVTRVTSAHSNELKALFDRHNIPYYIATGEAEQACAWLARHGMVDIVISEDYDALACGAPCLLRNLGSFRYEMVSLSLPAILDATQFTYAQFVDFCILCGTDFNDSLPKVGPVTAFNYIKTYGTIEALLRAAPRALRLDDDVMATFTYVTARTKFTDDAYPLTEPWVPIALYPHGDI